ncbi:hypothetical protein [Aureliella helgolandensis]|uniref:Uncharacterized protein n=1 Tax=Aureliella helgolandensis TaxID=2527968 RepID=A0A518G7C3_9BACT|nr:hypothetical protein [Aureliella helgolandensis]QDV24483.1 hypothetical protein Q31a_28010 [Aureliella helgolandensis]
MPINQVERDLGSINCPSSSNRCAAAHRKPLKLAGVMLLTAGCCLGGLAPQQAQAGPLIDWLFGARRTAPAYPVGQPVPVGSGNVAGYAPYNAAVSGYGTPTASPVPMIPNGYATNYGNYYGSQLPVIGSTGAGYSTPPLSGIAAATMPPTVSYVPNYGTQSLRAPVTYYRPMLSTDPRTGAQVVAMAPCTSYEYQAQRVPTLGRSSLFGSYAPPAAPQTAPGMQSYTLPSGGIPLGYAAPSMMAPAATSYGYTSGYGSYSALQTPTTDLTAPPPAYGTPGSYPTNQYGATPYYNTTPNYSTNNGGSCGGYSGSSSPGYPYTVPGLSAPPSLQAAPTSPPPSTSAPAPSGSYPGSTAPPSSSSPSGVYPGPSNDPADSPPSLPNFPTSTSAASNDSYRPSLRSITRQPRQEEDTTVAQPSTDQPRSSAPAMTPLPAPRGFDASPNWNPGLLREGDMTASHNAPPQYVPLAAQYAGQSTAIHWASFESETASRQTPELPTNRLQLRPQLPTVESESSLQRESSYGSTPQSGLRNSRVRPSTTPEPRTPWGELELSSEPAAISSEQSHAMGSPTPEIRPQTPTARPSSESYRTPSAAPASNSLYNTDGWKPVR